MGNLKEIGRKYQNDATRLQVTAGKLRQSAVEWLIKAEEETAKESLVPMLAYIFDTEVKAVLKKGKIKTKSIEKDISTVEKIPFSNWEKTSKTYRILDNLVKAVDKHGLDTIAPKGECLNEAAIRELNKPSKEDSLKSAANSFIQKLNKAEDSPELRQILQIVGAAVNTRSLSLL